jgi:hypothetical protein
MKELETETGTDPVPDTATFEIVPAPEEMIERINELHALVNHHARTSVEAALELGKMLCKCRNSISHGDWQKWIKANLAFSYKTAFRYQ